MFHKILLLFRPSWPFQLQIIKTYIFRIIFIKKFGSFKVENLTTHHIGKAFLNLLVLLIHEVFDVSTNFCRQRRIDTGSGPL